MTMSNVKVIKTVQIGGHDFQIVSGDYTMRDGTVVPNFIDGHFTGDADVRLPRKFWGMDNYKIARQLLAEGA